MRLVLLIVFPLLVGCFDVGHRVRIERGDLSADPPVEPHAVIDHGIRLTQDAVDMLADGQPGGGAFPVHGWCPPLDGTPIEFDHALNEREHIEDFARAGAERIKAPDRTEAGAVCIYRTRIPLAKLADNDGPLKWLVRAEQRSDGSTELFFGEAGCAWPKCDDPVGVAAALAAMFALDVCPGDAPGCPLLGVPGLAQSDPEELVVLLDIVLSSLSESSRVRPPRLDGVRWQAEIGGDVSSSPNWSLPASTAVTLGLELDAGTPGTPGGPASGGADEDDRAGQGDVALGPDPATLGTGDDICDGRRGTKEDLQGMGKVRRGAVGFPGSQSAVWFARWVGLPPAVRASFESQYSLAFHCLRPRPGETAEAWLARWHAPPTYGFRAASHSDAFTNWERALFYAVYRERSLDTFLRRVREFVRAHRDPDSSSYDPVYTQAMDVCRLMLGEFVRRNDPSVLDTPHEPTVLHLYLCKRLVRSRYDMRSFGASSDAGSVVNAVYPLPSSYPNFLGATRRAESVYGVPSGLAEPHIRFDSAGNLWVIVCRRTADDASRPSCVSADGAHPVPVISRTALSFLASLAPADDRIPDSKPLPSYGDERVFPVRMCDYRSYAGPGVGWHSRHGYPCIGEQLPDGRWRVHDGRTYALLDALWDGGGGGSSWDRASGAFVDRDAVARIKANESHAVRSAFGLCAPHPRTLELIGCVERAPGTKLPSGLFHWSRVPGVSQPDANSPSVPFVAPGRPLSISEFRLPVGAPECSADVTEDPALLRELNRGSIPFPETALQYEWRRRWAALSTERRRVLRRMFDLANVCYHPRRGEHSTAWLARTRTMTEWERHRAGLYAVSGSHLHNTHTWNWALRAARQVCYDSRPPMGGGNPPVSEALARTLGARFPYPLSMTYQLACSRWLLQPKRFAARLMSRQVGRYRPTMTTAVESLDSAGNAWLIACPRNDTDVSRRDCAAPAAAEPLISRTALRLLDALYQSASVYHGLRGRTARPALQDLLPAPPFGRAYLRYRAVRPLLCGLADDSLSSWDRVSGEFAHVVETRDLDAVRADERRWAEILSAELLAVPCGQAPALIAGSTDASPASMTPPSSTAAPPLAERGSVPHGVVVPPPIQEAAQ